MRSPNEHNGNVENIEDSNSFKELRLLQELEENPTITQRDLSQRLGVALGLTNTMVRNLAKKGFIRANQAGWKRWLYAITPEGFSRKLRLTVTYVLRVLDNYGRVRLILQQQLAPLALHQESRIAIYGTGDFAELVFLGLKDIGIEQIDVYSPDALTTSRFLGMPVRNSDSLNNGYYDKIVIAVLRDSEVAFKTLEQQGLAPDRLVSFFSDGKINNTSQGSK